MSGELQRFRSPSRPAIRPTGDSRRTGADLVARIDAVLDAALDERRLVGAVVLVCRDGAAVYRRAAGFADREARRPMREDALFRLASVSKPIVTATALALIDRGRLGFDAPVDRWLPEFCPRLPDGGVSRVTVRQLMSHTAGLGYRFLERDARGPYARAGVSDGMDRSCMSLVENVRRISRVPLQYVPGEGWGYSLATDVLGAVIERAAGLPLADAVRAFVTGPLGMLDTDFIARDPARLCVAYADAQPEPRRLREGEHFTHHPDAIGIRFAPSRATDSTQFPSGGAGMVGSADDFMRFVEAMQGGGAPVLPGELVEEMGRVQTGSLGLPGAPGHGYGLGVSVLRDPRVAASPESAGTWSWGGAYGHSWSLDRAAGLSLVAFTNTTYEGMSGRFVNELRDAIYR